MFVLSEKLHNLFVLNCSKYYENEEPNDDVWCGTWRPTKRRGPISAMYQSPGPQYLLPALTGKAKFDIICIYKFHL